MAIFAPPAHGSSGSTTYQIANSLRFDGSDDYLSRTFGTPTNNKIYTVSIWTKLGSLTAVLPTIIAPTGGGFLAIGDGTNNGYIRFNDGVACDLITSSIYRDPTAHYHFTVAVDTTQATAANRVKIYVNGTQLTAFSSGAYMAQNAAQNWNSAVAHNIGRRADATNYYSGYLSDIYFIDGQALTPSDFGELNAENVWVPKAYTGTYGNNGFHLDFSDGTSTTTLGYSAGEFSLNLRSSGTNIGDMTTNGGLAGGFDGVTIQAGASSAAKSGTGNIAAALGKDWGAGVTKTIAAFRCFTPSDYTGFTNSATKNVTIKLQGSTDNFSSSIVDLYTSGTIGAIGASATVQVTSGITVTTAYRYHRVLITESSGDGGGHTVACAELELYEAGTYGLNHWTLTGMTRAAGVNECWMVDTPTDNFAVLNPLDKGASASLTNGNLAANPNYLNSVRATAPMASGKYYFEVTPGSGISPFIGICTSAASVSADVFTQASIYAYYTNGNKVNNGQTAYGASYDSTNTIGVAFDGDAGTLTFYKDNTTQGTAFTGLTSGPYFPLVASGGGAFGYYMYANFGQRDFANTTTWATLEAAGYKRLSTANLPAVSILNPGVAFQAITATEDNIDANLATARSGWSDYVDIKKNRSASESWAWQFSHDSSNEYAIAASSVTRQTKRTNSGANSWVGYSIRIGAAYGTAAGSVSHTNGADTTITHNVGVSARQMIFLFPRAGGTVVRVYHPDLTSGYLLDLCSTAGEASNATIKTVTSNSFKIDTSVATGTYDYLVCSEISGLLKLGQEIGNGSSDGTWINANGLSSLFVGKKAVTGGGARGWRTFDTACNTYNACDNKMGLDVADAESSFGSDPLDIDAAGVKLRSNGLTLNDNTYRHVFACWLKHPFGGSNVSPAPAR